jgi:hypothetical protein
MVISFFVGLVASIFFGIIPLIICLVILFIIKKDKSMKILENGKKIFLGYFLILGIILSISSFYVSSSKSDRADHYDKEYSEDSYFSQRSKKLKLESKLMFFTGLVAVPIGGYILYFLSNLLFFNILRRHEQWIVTNGLFSDEENIKVDSTNIVGRDKLSSYSVADELLKWNDLLEKELITKEEFDKAKIKLMNGEKA